MSNGQGASAGARALADVRVLDLTRLLPGAFLTRVLADLGAHVDKIEDTGPGDYMRRFPPHAGGMNVVFRALNHGKRSLAVDLKSADGRALFLKLVAQYDVLIDSFRPGTLARLGLDDSTLLAANPRLVRCAVSGFGTDSELASKAGHDLNFLARGGVLETAAPADGPPALPPVQIADLSGALFAAIGIISAIRKRDQTGQGERVDVALADAALAMGVFGTVSQLAMNWPRGTLPLSGGLAAYGTYATKDGRTLVIAAIEPKFWEAFCTASGFAGNAGDLMPGPQQAEIKARLAAYVRERTAAEWEKLLANADACAEIARTPSELATDAHHQRGVFKDAAGGVILRFPFGDTKVTRDAPDQGADRDAILSDAGIDPSDIASLRERKIIG